ncbi:MAG: dTDP-4-dehydrorhamnose reductase [Schwartzia sp.]|nr:dTDP-4-dehydrorhamnose reductase [Schwartzia sp. (in: firmicutes)]
MKVLVTGITGQLGYDVMKELARRDIEAIGASRREMPLDEPDTAASFIDRVQPGAVIHCAAYTAVDKAEDEPALCRKINGDATGAIARAAAKNKAKLIYISTDYVFDGEGDRFYETGDPKGPRNVYGASKLAGEEAVLAAGVNAFIVRISWVFGINGKNFIRTMLQLAKTHDSLTVVDDQVGSPTYTADLARLLVDMVQTDRYGIYHATNEGVCSWAELAAEVFRQRGLGVKVTPVPSSAYPTKAVRPHNSRLSKASLTANGFTPLPPWQDAVRRYLGELAEKGE